ncbi:MAG: hypothetical protein Q7U75_12520 [Desulfobacterales bacterium]|nr:hypothetical protein [Desulfobacterales bacterium]
MLMRLAIPILFALALAGCTTGQAPRVQVSLPPVPEDIRACAQRHVPKPSGEKPLTEREVYVLISKLKASETAKSGCLVRLIALYEAQAAIVVEALR